MLVRCVCGFLPLRTSALEVVMATVRVSLSPSYDDVVVQTGGDTSDSDSSSSGSRSWSPSSSGSDSENQNIPSLSLIPNYEVSKRAHYALNCLQQACFADPSFAPQPPHVFAKN